MRCKKHFPDHSSAVGVCASCLREKLFALIAIQSQQIHHQQQQFEDRRKTELDSSQAAAALVFPRSVSPYISRRNSDTSPWSHRLSQSSFTEQRFYFTPQIGPNGKIVESNECVKKRNHRFGLFYNLFRSKSEKPNSKIDENCINSSSSSSSWFSILARKKQNRTFSVDESIRRRSNRDRGMSPARCSGGSSGGSGESSPRWKQTPRRRSSGRSRVSRNVSGMNFCLSPLVRASPNQQWSQKSLPPEMEISGDVRAPAKSQSSSASSFCKNGSRKLADFGRVNRNHRFRNS